MKKHYVIILLLSSFFVQSQEAMSGKTSISLDIAPLIVSPRRLSVGVAYQISPRFFVGIEGGKSFSASWGRTNGESENYKLNQYRLEAGYILNPNNDHVNHFLSLDFVGINHKETLLDGDFWVDYNNTSKRYSYLRADYSRKKHVFHINYGLKVFFSDSKKVGVEPKIGLGIGNTSVDFTNTINQKEIDNDQSLWGVNNRYELAGKEQIGNVNFQIRFFYVF